MEQKKTVLIVEDEKNIVDIIRFNLQRTGYDTLEAYDGEAGLALAREKGSFFAINFNHRYAEPVVRAKAAIALALLARVGAVPAAEVATTMAELPLTVLGGGQVVGSIRPTV